MILVDNQPVLSLEKDDKRRDWYETEVAKIRNLREPIVIKKISTYRLNSKGIRVKPPRIGVQSFKEYASERGMEVWGCCTTYEKKDNGTLSLKPNFYYFESQHTLDPRKDSELIFYLTCIINLTKLGFAIDNPEAEAKKYNDGEIAELEVKYAIHKQLEDIEELKFMSRAWGISGADKMQIEQLRRVLFETVKKSEENKKVTKKGYAEFMEEVFNKNPEVTEARAMVNMALGKSILSVAKTTRKVSYVPSGDVLCIVPLEHITRTTDYIADYLLRDKNKDLLETIRQDVMGVREEFKISIADVELMKDRASLLEVAKKLSLKGYTAMKDETLKTRIIEKIS